MEHLDFGLPIYDAHKDHYDYLYTMRFDTNCVHAGTTPRILLQDIGCILLVHGNTQSLLATHCTLPFARARTVYAVLTAFTQSKKLVHFTMQHVSSESARSTLHGDVTGFL